MEFTSGIPEEVEEVTPPMEGDILHPQMGTGPIGLIMEGDISPQLHRRPRISCSLSESRKVYAFVVVLLVTCIGTVHIGLHQISLVGISSLG